ncbi:MAG: murein transglycosylase A, partial [Alphaproteobacteria bacterium]|nr:murein transglycosylase A [Alphaproteobacteria bacterium]
MTRSAYRLLCALLLCAGLASCARFPLFRSTGPDKVVLESSSYGSLPGWQEDAVADVLPALRRSCAAMEKMPGRLAIGDDGLAGTAADWGAPCRAAERVPAGDHDSARRFFEQWFDPYLVTNKGEAKGTFTGYYEIELKGSLGQGGAYQTPLLGKPKDLVSADLELFNPEWKQETVVGRVENGRFKPYPTRSGIEAGALAGVVAPVLWVDDPVDAFLLHIQGSGRVRLDNGQETRIGYAADNGHKFVGIGNIMVKRGLIPADQLNMPAIQSWMRAHPDEAREIQTENPRYIFFRLISGEGPIGAQGVALTPGRSLAVDPKFVPLGVPLWLDTTEPGGGPLRRLVMAQDSGGAIKGPVRG